MSSSLQHPGIGRPRSGVENATQTTAQRIMATSQVTTRAQMLLDAAGFRLDRALLVLAMSQRLAERRRAEADVERRHMDYGRRLTAE